MSSSPGCVPTISTSLVAVWYCRKKRPNVWDRRIQVPGKACFLGECGLTMRGEMGCLLPMPLPSVSLTLPPHCLFQLVENSCMEVTAGDTYFVCSGGRSQSHISIQKCVVLCVCVTHLGGVWVLWLWGVCTWCVSVCGMTVCVCRMCGVSGVSVYGVCVVPMTVVSVCDVCVWADCMEICPTHECADI